LFAVAEALQTEDAEKIGFRHIPEAYFFKHLMKPANPFRFTGTPPACGLSGLPISPLHISIYNVIR
jgi:molybdopterin biosynthesis enzyme